MPEARNADDPEGPSSSVTVAVVVPQIDVIVAGPHFQPQFRPALPVSASGIASGGPVVSSSTSPQRRVLLLPMAPPPPPPLPSLTPSPLKCVPHPLRMRKSAPLPHEEPSSSIPEIGQYHHLIYISSPSNLHTLPATSGYFRSNGPIVRNMS